nr:transporter [Bacteroidota bacterium]
RVTLVHNAFPERITMDFDLRFLSNDRITEIPYLGIAEIKQDASSGTSDLEKIMRSLDIFPMKFSKYCMGSVLLDNTLKYNRFKTKLITLKKISNDGFIDKFYN